MDILLVLNSGSCEGELKVMVSVTQKELKRKVISLLGENKRREVIDILKSQAEVEAYFPVDSKIPKRSAMLALYE